MTGFTVVPEDLQGYAELIRRQRRAAEEMHSYALTNLADGDFGRLMDLMTGDYETLLPQVHAFLATQASKLGEEADAFDTAAHSYLEMDADARRRYDQQVAAQPAPVTGGRRRAF